MKAYSDAEIESEIQFLVDSLADKGFVLLESPYPIQIPNDTASFSISGIKRIPFSEADSITLQIVPGIGPSLAGRIIKFEQALGGFFKPDQLLDVYGVKPEVANRVWEYFEFDGKIKSKVPINTIDVTELAKHPYVSYGQAKVLVAFRNQHGAFLGPEDLLKIKIFEKEWVDKLSPYLAF
ncbi:ComEA family DNA-binding protein [Algoriphagus limi]|uniref:Helix-hairpin-helix domain-containing protein n=1 Tax=Algoriphagus limi TaxID=2975273 RepID=A0ABT2G3A5_9BACT|nr:helix-hairpin-helix domain-containing protein [Algoriphagus limi]MCS5489752.1 helix-hairpin-helix domain-containing protein [Algoriphagus limi]